MRSSTCVAGSVWDHPCDEYYKNMYKEEKQKLAEKKVKDAEKARADKEAKAERKKKKKEFLSAREKKIQKLKNRPLHWQGLK